MPINPVIEQLFIMNQVLMYLVGFLLVLVLLFMMKTPGTTFLKAFLSGNPIMVVKRKDGKYNFTKGRYTEGVIWHKYGFHQIDPEANFREKKSGCDFHLGLDSIGITLSEKMLMALKWFKEAGYNDINEIQENLQLWRKCTNKECDFEGLPDKKLEEETETSDKKGKVIKVRKFSMTCPKCGGTKFEKTLPDMDFDRFKVLDPGFIDNYFKYNMNPRTNEIVSKQEAMNEVESERKRQPILWVSIGVTVLLILMGFMILYTVVSKDTSGIEAAASGIMNTNPLGGLTG